MDTVTRVQILFKAVYILHGANTFGKLMNPTIPLPAMDRQGSLNLVWQPIYEKENSKFRSVKHCLKINLVSHLAGSEGLINIHTHFLWENILRCIFLVF